MKKIYSILLLCSVVLFTGCSKDDDDSFDYNIDLLHGEWRVTSILQSDGSYFDVTTVVGERVFKPTYATFNSNGTYSGRGEFGTGSGTYVAKGKTIITYIDKTEYLRYDVLSLTGTKAELKMYEKGDNSSITIKVEKQ